MNQAWPLLPMGTAIDPLTRTNLEDVVMDAEAPEVEEETATLDVAGAAVETTIVTTTNTNETKRTTSTKKTMRIMVTEFLSAIAIMIILITTKLIITHNVIISLMRKI